jgi:hypothetical protein
MLRRWWNFDFQKESDRCHCYCSDKSEIERKNWWLSACWMTIAVNYKHGEAWKGMVVPCFTTLISTERQDLLNPLWVETIPAYLLNTPTGNKLCSRAWRRQALVFGIKPCSWCWTFEILLPVLFRTANTYIIILTSFKEHFVNLADFFRRDGKTCGYLQHYQH